MPTYEHATSIGVWFFKALMESSKLRQMTFSEEAAHRNKAQARFQSETRWTASAPEDYATFDEPHVLILQGVATVADEASSPVGVVNVYVPYPQGTALTPFVRRPIPIVQGFRAIMNPFPGTPTLANLSYRDIDFELMDDQHISAEFEAMPEANVGANGIDAVTDFRTSLVISHRWSNNTASIGEVRHGGYLMWRTIGHVAAY